MSRNRRDDPGSSRERTPEQRERDRLERQARRAGGEQGADRPAPRAPGQPPSDRDDRHPPTATDRPARPVRGAARPPARAGTGEPPPVRRGRAGRDQSSVLRIQPKPPAPPAAPAGALDDEPERPIGIRRVRRAVAPRTSRTIVTPPGDVPGGPARARRSARGRAVIVLALLVLAALIAGVLVVFQPLGSVEGDPVRVTIARGSSAREIGDQLAAAGVVGDGRLFSLRAALAGKRGDLRSGTHLLRRDMTYGAALDALSKPLPAGGDETFDVTIPEGRSRTEIARLLRSAGLSTSYLAASKRFSGRLNPFRYGAPRGTRSTEGFLFPATYQLRKGAPAKDLVNRQLKAFKQNFAGVDLSRAKSRNLTAYDVLIIASMVEREARLASERKLVAAVIYNRLKDGIPLGIDATIRYATDNWSRPLLESQLQIDSAYNTRKRTGLPPTPIGNPGLASIRAAAAPASVGYRYYVVQPGTCGKHAFSSSFAKFQADSRRYDQARSAAGGKSPTTC